MTRANSSKLSCERLEARDVPAIILDGTFNGSTTVANGGFVNISEVGGTITVVDSSLLNPQVVSLSNTANDAITLSLSGTTLTVTNPDGVYIRVLGTGAIVQAGTSVTVANATGVSVGLQLGGNDSVADNTTLNANIDGGPGNDTITSAGLVLPFLPSPLDPALFPLLGASGGMKNLRGGDGDDSITGPLLGFFNQLDGGNGNDIIIGGIGPDVLIGGDGVDVLAGIGGADIYLSLDLAFDYDVNFIGDVVFADPFDLVAVM